MRKIELLDQFIELRALGYPYDDIVKKLGVSKVTLLRWNKKHYDSIDAAKKEMVLAAAKKISFRNSNMLSKFAELVLSEYRKGKDKPTINEVYIKRFFRNVFLVYARKMKSLYVEFDKNWKPSGVVIQWKDE